jgi:hypothetical protein
MTAWRRAAAWLFVAAAACLGRAAPIGAQSVSLAIAGLSADSTSPAPIMSIVGFETRPELGPYSVSLELSLESQFRAPFYAKTAGAESATFSVDSLLPARAVIYFRVRLSDRFGNVVAEARDQHAVRSWLRLVSVGQPSTRTPQFNWSSPLIANPPGPWVYDLTVINSASGKPEFVAQAIRDTSYVFPRQLESSTSYRWQVHARAENGAPGDEITVTGESFVILSADQPTVTLFYQNFPNPFGRATPSERTCFWFDLAHPSNVTLTIYDITLREVRRIIPGAFGTGQQLAVGAYGRDAQRTCVDELTWDGHDDTGRTVPAGVYLAIFKGDGVRTSVKALYKGP